MPYIDRERRIPLDKRGYKATTSGELNYAITRLCNLWLLDHGTTYGEINAVIGALECAKQEFYRRVAVPYEDEKREQNGDVYPDVAAASWHRLADAAVASTATRGPLAYVDRHGDRWCREEDGNGWRCYYSDGSPSGSLRHVAYNEIVTHYGPLTPLP